MTGRTWRYTSVGALLAVAVALFWLFVFAQRPNAVTATFLAVFAIVAFLYVPGHNLMPLRSRPADPWLDRLATRLSGGQIRERRRHTGDTLMGHPLDGDLVAGRDDATVFVNVLRDTAAAMAAASGLRVKHDHEIRSHTLVVTSHGRVVAAAWNPSQSIPVDFWTELLDHAILADPTD
jgi:hypothetical protein